jgi:RNA polymerase sigma-70 factor (ECF subfamily)
LVTALDQVFKDHWSSVLANLVGFLGDFDVAEEATQTALTLSADPAERRFLERRMTAL